MMSRHQIFLFFRRCTLVLAATILSTSLPVGAFVKDELYMQRNNVLYVENCAPGSGSGSTADAAVTGGENGWVYPTDKAKTQISSDYKSPERPGHRGADIAGPIGTPVYSSKDGEVIHVGIGDDPGGFGNWVVIKHEENGKRVDSTYGHMPADSIKVKKGDKVKAGQQIAVIGNEGGSSGPHLHYEEWDNGRQGFGSGSERKPIAVYGNSGTATSEPAADTLSSDAASGAAACCGESGAATTVGGGGGDCGSPLPASVPEYWRNLIDNAAAKYPDTDRRAVAATLWVENRGWPDPNKQWAVSSASAAGPWQFIPSSWASMGQDCNNDGTKNANDPEDAVCAAFVHLKGTGCKPLLEGATGDIEKDWTSVPYQDKGNNTVISAIQHYNGSGAQEGVPLSEQPHNQNGDYIQMAYWLIASDFKTSYNPDTGQKGDATKATSDGAGAAAPVSDTAAAACPTAEEEGGDTGIPAAECGPLVEEVKRLRSEGKLRSINGEQNLNKDLENCTEGPIECGNGGKGGVTPQLLRAFVAVVRHIDSKKLGPVVFASMNTGHDCDGKMHPQGKAVDFWDCKTDPSAEDKLCHEIFTYIFTNAAELGVRQLIHNHQPPGQGCTSSGVFLCDGSHNNEVHLGM